MHPAVALTRRLAPLACLLMLPLAGSAAAQNAAAHELAEKFSGAAEQAKADADARRKAEEAEMLARAREEAAARTAESERRAAAEESARREAMEKEREAEAERLSEKLKRADEARRIKATAEAAAKKAAEAESQKALEAEAATKAANEAEPDAGPASEPRQPPAVAAKKILPPPMALGQAESSTVRGDDRVTILLVMEPGNKGIRRFNKTADPVLCQGSTCFVSTGNTTPARSLDIRKALGAGNTFGPRAGACRQKLACAFRGVPLGGHTSTIQPVDLKVLVHDRRTPRTVSGDSSCRIVSGALSCGRTVTAPGYRAWVVPEAIAERAGATAIEAALSKGLVSTPLREAEVRD